MLSTDVVLVEEVQERLNPIDKLLLTDAVRVWTNPSSSSASIVNESELPSWMERARPVIWIEVSWWRGLSSSTGDCVVAGETAMRRAMMLTVAPMVSRTMDFGVIVAPLH